MEHSGQSELVTALVNKDSLALLWAITERQKSGKLKSPIGRKVKAGKLMK